MALKKTKPESSEQVLRVSFSWFIGCAIAVLLLGVVGGIVGQQLFRPTLPPLENAPDRIATTVQQVTISPNQAAGELVTRAERSVLALGRGEEGQQTVFGTGTVVTNDGLIVTTIESNGSNHVAFDQTGAPIVLERVGHDAIYGLTYYRAQNNVLVPLDVRSDDGAVGQEFIAMARDERTFLPRIRSLRVQEFDLPDTGDPIGAQRIIRGTTQPDTTFSGSPLLDDESRLSGIVLNATSGKVLPASQIKLSLQRISNNKREYNPLTELGLNLTYDFVRVTPDADVQFIAKIAGVTPNSSATIANLKVGDIITAIGEQPLAWGANVVEQLSAPLPLQLTILEKGAEKSVTLQPVALP